MVSARAMSTPSASLLAVDYVSPPARGGWRRTFPALHFYPGLLGIVRRAGARAKRGHYTDEEWIKSSVDTVRLAASQFTTADRIRTALMFVASGFGVAALFRLFSSRDSS